MKLPIIGQLASGKYRGIIKFLYRFFYLGILGVVLYVLALNFNLFYLFGKLPTVDDLDNPKSELASEIISSDGKIIGKFFHQNRSPEEFENLPNNLIDALIATEDVRYTRHGGIDARSLMRAVGGVLTFNKKGGGSTISQQLAKNLFRMRADDEYQGLLYKIPVVRTIVIKTKEWVTSIKLERRYTKQEIMKMYLDTIEFSSGAHGIKSAAKTYFNKKPQDLTTEQAALLVGMIQNPSRFNPKLRPKNAIVRRNNVLNQMVKYKKITPEQGIILKAKPIVLDYKPESHNYGLAPYFREILRKWAENEITKFGYTKNDLYTKGFKIHTTIDSRMQKYAEDAVQEHMADQQKKFNAHWGNRNPWVQRVNSNSSSGGYKEIPNFIENIAKRTHYYQVLKRKYGNDQAKIMAGMNKKTEMTVFTYEGEKDTLMSHLDSLRHYKRFLNTGLLAMDPNNGNIKAWVGGINFKYFKYDHVKQSTRQPGSTFKPFVYVTAIDKGFATCQEVVDEPITFTKEEFGIGQNYTPKNADGRYTYRKMTLRQALGKSVNSVSARLIKQFLPKNVVKMAHELGIKSPLDNSPSLCLGVSDVSLYELLAAYAVFANGGKYTEPLFVTSINDKHGELISTYLPDQKEVLSAESAYKMIHLMKGNTIPGGTGYGLSRYGVLKDNEVAGKTGTTSNYSDGWYMGMTQDLIGGVWTGGDDRAIHFRNIALGQGARVAMPAYGLFMQKVYEDKDLPYKRGKFKMPSNLRVLNDCVYSPGEGFMMEGDKDYVPPPVQNTAPLEDEELL